VTDGRDLNSLMVQSHKAYVTRARGNRGARAHGRDQPSITMGAARRAQRTAKPVISRQYLRTYSHAPRCCEQKRVV